MGIFDKFFSNNTTNNNEVSINMNNVFTYDMGESHYESR